MNSDHEWKGHVMRIMDRPVRPVFGIADPRDYMKPLCTCGHVYDEHYDGQGTPPDPRRTEPEDGEMAPCWDGWHDDVEGCQCLEYRRTGDRP